MNPVTPGRSSLSSSGFSLDSILYTISKQTLCLSSSLKREGEKKRIVTLLFSSLLHTEPEDQFRF